MGLSKISKYKHQKTNKFQIQKTKLQTNTIYVRSPALNAPPPFVTLLNAPAIINLFTVPAAIASDPKLIDPPDTDNAFWGADVPKPTLPPPEGTINP